MAGAGTLPTLTNHHEEEGDPIMDKQTRDAWLIGHDYLTIFKGRDCLSLDAFALLGNVSPERLRQGFRYDPDADEFDMDEELKQDVMRGTQELMAKHDTTNMLDILYLEAQQHEADKEKL